MKLRMTLTQELDNYSWGFTDLIGDRNIKDKDVQKEIFEFIMEDMTCLFESPEYIFEIIEK